MNSPLAVVALVGRMVVLFALLMLVPLAFALSDHDPAEQAFLVATAISLAARWPIPLSWILGRGEPDVTSALPVLMTVRSTAGSNGDTPVPLDADPLGAGTVRVDAANEGAPLASLPGTIGGARPAKRQAPATDAI